MANNKNLHKANKAKNDEFYTQYKDIELEIEAYNKESFTGKTVYCCCDDVFTSNFAKYFLNNFKRLELKELIVSGFSTTEKGTAYYFRTTDPAKYIEDGIFKTELIKTEVKEMKRDGIYDGGDFRSAMATELLKQSDIVITNPPFSLFREFIAWIMEVDKKFIIIGNKNAITYKEFFPLLKDNKAWIGTNYVKTFKKPDGKIQKFGNVGWFTNVDHGRRHQKLSLMTMEENLKYSKHKSLREQGYLKYDNYDAIEVPYTDAIPSDYEPCWFKCPHTKECVYAQTEGFTDEALCEKGFLKKKSLHWCPHYLFGQAQPRPIRYCWTRPICLRQSSLWTPIQAQQQRDICPSSYPKESVTELWAYPSLSLINSVLNNSGLSEQRKVKARDSQMDCGTKQARLLNHLLIGNANTRDCSFKKCNGIMGVPVTFLDKYNPDQFKILGMSASAGYNKEIVGIPFLGKKDARPLINNKNTYARILIKQKSGDIN